MAPTPPSTEFSIGTIAAVISLSRTAASAASTLGYGSRSPVCAARTCSSAASVNVPAGPR